MLKQVLTGKDDEPPDQWEAREGFALKPRPGKDAKGAATAKRKVTGDGKGGRPPAGPKRRKKDVEEVDDTDPSAPSALRHYEAGWRKSEPVKRPWGLELIATTLETLGGERRMDMLPLQWRR